jgi:hypothetical protein
VFDSDGIVIDLQEVRTGILAQGQVTKISSEWSAPDLEGGEYVLKIFVIDGSNGKIPLLLKNSISAGLEVT